jgi:hypothetical protein
MEAMAHGSKKIFLDLERGRVCTAVFGLWLAGSLSLSIQSDGC